MSTTDTVAPAGRGAGATDDVQNADRPPEPVDANVVVTDNSRRSSRRSSLSRASSPALRRGKRKDGAKSGRSSRLSSRMSSRAVSPASTTMQEAGFATPQGKEPAKKTKLKKGVQALAGGTRMSLYPDRYPETMKRRVFDFLKLMAKDHEIEEMLEETIEKREDEDADAGIVTLLEQLDDDFEEREDVRAEVLNKATTHLMGQIATRFTTLGSALGTFLEAFIDMVNNNQLSEKQATRVFLRFFQGKLKTSMKRRLNREGLRATILQLERHHCPELRAKDLIKDVKMWRFDTAKPVGGQLDDLLLKLCSAFPDDSMEEIDGKLFTLCSIHIPQAEDLMAKLQTRARRRSGKRPTFEQFVREVEKHIQQLPPTSKRNVGVADATAPVNAVVPAQVPPPAHDPVLESVLEELRQARAAFSPESIKAMLRNAHAEGMQAAICQMQATMPIVPREQPIFYDPTQPLPRVPQPMGNSTLLQPLPMQALPQPQQQSAPLPPPLESGATQRIRYLRSTDKEYWDAREQLSKAHLAPNVQEKPGDPVYFTRCPDGTISINPGVPVKKFPKKYAVFCVMPGNERPRTTRQVQEHFQDRCPTCGIIGHRSVSASCPFRESADSWHLCTRCRLGFHERCRYNQDFLDGLN